MTQQEWLDQITEAFRYRIAAALAEYRAAGLDPWKVLGSPDSLGERAAMAVWSDFTRRLDPAAKDR